MKLLVPLCFGIIMTGVAYSLYNAANDYGLATISLPPAITAQIDNTSGGDETSGNPIDCKRSGFICYAEQLAATYKYSTFSDNNGYIILVDGTRVRQLPNTWYDIEELYIGCRSTENESDVCDTKKRGSFIISSKPVGDGTN